MFCALLRSRSRLRMVLCPPSTNGATAAAAAEAIGSGRPTTLNESLHEVLHVQERVGNEPLGRIPLQ